MLSPAGARHGPHRRWRIAPSNQNIIYALAAINAGEQLPGRPARRVPLDRRRRTWTSPRRCATPTRQAEHPAALQPGIALPRRVRVRTARTSSSTRAGTTTSSRSIRRTRTASGPAASTCSARMTAARTGASPPTGGSQSTRLVPADLRPRRQPRDRLPPALQRHLEQDDVRRQRRRRLPHDDAPRRRRHDADDVRRRSASAGGRRRTSDLDGPEQRLRRRRSSTTACRIPDGATYFGGTQDNGTHPRLARRGSNGWPEILGGDGGYVAVNPNNTNVLFAEFTGLSIRSPRTAGASFFDAVTGITGDPRLPVHRALPHERGERPAPVDRRLVYLADTPRPSSWPRRAPSRPARAA